MLELQEFLRSLVNYIRNDWRRKRKDKQDKILKDKTGINLPEWEKSIPPSAKKHLDPLISTLQQDSEHPEKEDNAIRGFEHLHELIPSYPYFHWRQLHEKLKKLVFPYYQAENYYMAVFEGCKLYISEVEAKSSLQLSERNLLEKAFAKSDPVLQVVRGYKKRDGSPFQKKTLDNMEEGNRLLAIAMWQAFRCPVAHEIVEELSGSGLFSEKDCLDALGILSHLFRRLDNAEKTVYGPE